MVLSDPLITQIERRPAIVMARRLEKPDGTFDGVVQAVVDLEEFQRVYKAIDLGQGSAVNLLRDDGTLFVRQPQIPQVVGRKFPEMVATASDPSDLVLHTMDQQPRFVGIAHVRGFPLVIAVSRDESTALEGWRDDAWHIAARTLILALLGAAAIVALVYQLRRAQVGERALRQSEERYALAMEGANEGHFDWNLGQGDSFVSPKMKLLHGRSVDAPVTTRDAWLAALDIHSDDAPRMFAAVRDHLEGRSDHYEAEYRVRHPDGEWHWLQARGLCIRDAAGKVHRFVGSAIDITARKNAEAEKERLERELRQSQKMEAMGTLAGGIAQEFSGLLSTIMGYAVWVADAVPGNPELRGDVRQIIGGADGMVADVGVYMPLPGSSKKLIMFAGPSITYADHRYLQKEFGVTPAQALASGYPVYNPHAGTSTMGFGFSATRFLTDHWLINLDGAVNHLLGSARQSPITQRTVQGAVALSFGYTW